MQVSLIDIGTSKGIRIPASILKIFDRPTSFDLHVRDDKIILDVINNPRSGWDNKFKNSDDEQLIEDSLDLGNWDEL